MAINYATKKNSEKTKQKKGVGMTIVFYALNFLLVPFSAYQTYVGYSEFLGEFPALILAAVSALIFFGLNYTIKERRGNGQPHFIHSLGYLLPLCISLPGNFNSIYGAQMQETLVAKELAVYSNVLNSTYTDGVASLNSSTGLTDLRAALTSQLISLETQIKVHGGFGKEAAKEWTSIETLFKAYNAQYRKSTVPGLTKVRGTDYDDFEETAELYYDGIEQSKSDEIYAVVQPLKVNYDSLNITYDRIIRAEAIKSEGFGLLEELRKTNNNIGNSFKSYIADTVLYNFQLLEESDERQVGTIKHSLESAFVKFENPSATFFGTFFSLIIDLIPLGFLFLVFPYTKNSQRKQRAKHTIL
ncbi:MAG: hypothetical protein GQ574_27490 [Crocinitomix sp.]|nr:hypothetical protein [Crocinitomix sp.]